MGFEGGPAGGEGSNSDNGVHRVTQEKLRSEQLKGCVPLWQAQGRPKLLGWGQGEPASPSCSRCAECHSVAQKVSFNSLQAVQRPQSRAPHYAPYVGEELGVGWGEASGHFSLLHSCA